MTLEQLSPIIALAGVVISIVASVLVSARQSKLEIKKLRTELQMSYASKLVDKRMEAYPLLFKLIIDFEKSAKYRVAQKADADKLLKNILEWDFLLCAFHEFECHPEIYNVPQVHSFAHRNAQKRI